MKKKVKKLTAFRLHDKTTNKAAKIGKAVTGYKNATAGIEYAVDSVDLDKLKRERK